ncbi:MAG: hypothetical protein P4M08_14785 [Oligoflexia bacterium]|nr:hypothetical protein [Oligoflexia bacterium]
MRFAYLAVVFVLSTGSVFASETPPPGLDFLKLLTITNDKTPDVNDLEIGLDDKGSPAGMEVTLEGDTTDAPAYFSVSDISSGKGLVLKQEQGYNVLILKGGVNLDASSATMTLSYLANGLTGSYNDCDVIVNRVSGADWNIENAYTHEIVQSVHVKTWMFGISTLEGLCPAN